MDPLQVASSTEEVCVADAINVIKASIASATHVIRDKEIPSSEFAEVT